MEITKRLRDYGVNQPDMQTMLDLAAEVVYSKPGMTDPSKIDEAGEKMFLMVECGFRRRHDAGLPVDQQYFERLYAKLWGSKEGTRHGR